MAVNRLGDPGFLDGKAKSKSFRDALSAPFEFALVGKFLGRRLPLDLIQKFFFNLKMGGFSLTDRISLLTRFMKLLKWSPIFDVNVESPIVPVWVSFPSLCPHFFLPHTFHGLGSLFGRP
ncbi:uncharacterized protein LOC114580947 isoform X3 [Dendrobium catenatum]|uniref:uncharacterized protein LOC114580947 isoform X3 n=1 Tax=Dendrobium catenatum TaxID=906689 RepID=UPI0010A07F17|nr:uncharacterized protein LOC114580947 isoform X3 [Dendrobium catenatum]